MSAARNPSAEQLTGPEKCAILCMALGAQESARILKQLTQEEVELVSREIANLRAVAPEIVRAVILEYQQASQKSATMAHGGVDYARQVLEQTLGPSRAGDLIGRITQRLNEGEMARLKKATPDVLLGILAGEHPQTIALVLAYLPQTQASRLLRAMNPELAAEVLYRMARMERISPDVLAIVEAGLNKKTEVSLERELAPAGGPMTVAKLLNLGGENLERPVLEAIGSRSDELATQIRNLMFTFEDLILVDSKGIQRLLREIDTKELALSLKVASEEVKKHIRSNMSERAASALDEEIELMGPVRAKDVEAAHARIVEIVRRLDQDGEIIVRRQGGDGDVIA